MGFYANYIFPLLCNATLDRPFVAAHRRRLLAGASGEILEIGLGTGLNLPCYPESVRRITAVDPNPGMHRKAQAAIERTRLEVDKRLLGGEQLPFEDGRFDCVVSTFTLCSIDQVERALGEIYRVLRPGGQLLLLEHGLSPDAKVSKWQHRLNGMQRFCGGNCHLNRDIKAIVGRQPFDSIRLDEFYLEKTPRTHGYLYLGAATK